MDKSEWEELSQLTIDAARYLKTFQLDSGSNDVCSRVESILSLLHPAIKAIGSQGTIGESSPLLPTLERCKRAVVKVFRRVAVVPIPITKERHQWREIVEDELNEAFEELSDCTNIFLLVIEAGPSFQSANSRADVERVFDTLAQSVLSVASQIFSHSKRLNTNQETFTVEELTVVNGPNASSSRVVCPKARIDATSKKPRSVKFACCCDDASHESQIDYKLFRGKSLLREEIGLDGSRRWSILLLSSNKPVIVRLLDVPLLCISRVQSLADDIGIAYLTVQNKFSREPNTDIKTGRFECFQTDWGFPSTKVRTVKCESVGVKRSLETPSKVVLKHYSKLRNPITGRAPASLAPSFPERYYYIILEKFPFATQAKRVLVTAQTEIFHEDNPLGRLFVTLQDVILAEGDEVSERKEFCNVHFGFDERREAECFAHYLEVAQRTLFEKFMRSPFHDEQVIYSRDLHAPAIDVSQAQLQFSIVSRGLGGSKYARRAILMQSNTTRHICFEFESKGPSVKTLDLLQSQIWVYDHDANGKPYTSQTDWETLVGQRVVNSVGRTTVHNHDANSKPYTLQRDWGTLTGESVANSIETATFVKGGHERTANDWLEELDKLLRVMKPDRTDRYEKVKIAVIDSGLNDTVKRRYMVQNKVVYKDFTQETRNDSWHGTCCAKIICDIYEEAILFIARIFEKDHASDEEGPIRMAKAIDWAISNRVDIISISAGFRDYSKELDEAVTRAKAAGTLVVAAAANWSNTGTVAFPARHNLTTMCMYSTNMGNQSSSFNPEPRSDTSNFAVLGEGFQHPDQKRNEPMSGTSMATATAVGLAANIIDFSRQEDNKSYICRSQDVGKLPGMLSIFSSISRPAGSLRYIAPLDLLPANHGWNRERGRQRVREILSLAMERAN